MDAEFARLQNLGWEIPARNQLGLFIPKPIDESQISFPLESYDSTENNNCAKGFWAIERAKAIARMLDLVESKTLWELGAGNGNATFPLRDLGFDVIPIEPLQSGATTLAKNGFPTFLSTLEDLKLPSNAIDAIGAFDVLEHIEDPSEILFEIYRVLKPNGVFVCSVPAYQWLFSDFDMSIGHFRRYSTRELNSSFSSVGLKPIKTTYLFGFLVLPAFILRRIPFLLGRQSKFDEVHKSNNARFSLLSKFEYLLRAIVSLERMFRIKIGLSLISLARK